MDGLASKMMNGVASCDKLWGEACTLRSADSGMLISNNFLLEEITQGIESS